MSSGERPIGAAKGKQSDTEALCQPRPQEMLSYSAKLCPWALIISYRFAALLPQWQHCHFLGERNRRPVHGCHNAKQGQKDKSEASKCRTTTKRKNTADGGVSMYILSAVRLTQAVCMINSANEQPLNARNQPKSLTLKRKQNLWSPLSGRRGDNPQREGEAGIYTLYTPTAPTTTVAIQGDMSGCHTKVQTDPPEDGPHSTKLVRNWGRKGASFPFQPPDSGGLVPAVRPPYACAGLLRCACYAHPTRLFCG